MQAIRRLFLVLFSAGLVALLSLTALTWTVRQTVGDRQVVKTWIKESNAYSNFVDEAAKIAEKELSKNTEQGKGDQPNFDIKTLSAAAKKAFPSDVLEANVEQVLDGTYDWLEGKTDTLKFSIDLTEEKKVFINALGNEAIAKAASLPTCPAGTNLEDFDPFSASCMPSGTDINQQVEKFKQEFANNPDFLGDPIINEEDVKVGESASQLTPADTPAKTPSEAFKEAPKWYGYGKMSALVITGMLVLTSFLVFILSKTRRGGLKVLAWLYGLSGLGLLLLGIAGRVFVGNYVGNFGQKGDENGLAETILVPLSKQVTNSISRWNLTFGAIFVFVSLACVIIVLATRKHKHPDQQSHVEDVKHPSEAGKPFDKMHPESVEAKKAAEPKGPPQVKNKSVQG